MENQICLQFHRMLAKGQGAAKDDAEAAKWHRRAAEQGHAGAQAALGLIYEKGQGVSQDLVAAMRWYGKAAKQGNPIAIGRLAKLRIDHPELAR